MLRQSYHISFLYPLAYIFPASLSLGPFNTVGATVLVCIFPTFRRLMRSISSGRFVLVISDLCVTSMCAWMLLSLFSHVGLAGLYGSGAFAATQFFCVYFICRVFFSQPNSFLIFSERMAFVVCVTLFYALLDTVTSQNFVFRIGLSASGGGAQQPLASEAYRFGLVRAQGSLEHPILMGVFFVISAVLLSSSMLTSTKKAVAIAVCAAGTILSLSSAPFLSSLQAAAIIVYFRLFSRFPWAKLLLWSTSILIVFFIAVFFDKPIETLISALTLDPQTGFYRMEIWRWVAFNVKSSPWLGIGFADWVRAPNMSATIDSVWLVQSVRYGLPAAALLLLSCLTTGLTIWRARRGNFLNPLADKMSLALGVVIFLLVFNGVSVHIWGFNWYYLAAVLGMRAGLTEHNIILREALNHKRGGLRSFADQVSPSVAQGSGAVDV